MLKLYWDRARVHTQSHTHTHLHSRHVHCTNTNTNIHTTAQHRSYNKYNNESIMRGSSTVIHYPNKCVWIRFILSSAFCMCTRCAPIGRSWNFETTNFYSNQHHFNTRLVTPKRDSFTENILALKVSFSSTRLESHNFLSPLRICSSQSLLWEHMMLNALWRGFDDPKKRSVNSNWIVQLLKKNVFTIRIKLVIHFLH